MTRTIIRAICCFLITCCTLWAGAVFSQSIPAGTGVLLDPAHGGADPGVKVSDKIQEKELTLKLALLIQKELMKGGNTRVVLTREQDKDVSLAERIKKIELTQPRVMVSLHVNGGFYKTAKGFEIYFPGFKMVKTGKDDSAAIIGDMKKNKYLNESVRLAQNIQKQLESVFPKENRGLREAPLQLLEGMTVPGVVVEIGFGGNPENRKKLLDEKYQQDIARALSKGIRDSL
jgi:N-acetylmuramoyl-L-alanine amidase